MRKLLNDPYAVVDEMVEGIAAAHPGRIELTPSRRGIVATARAPGRRVGIVVGGGSGHGFKHGPAVGEYVAARVTDAKPVENKLSLATKQKVQARTVF